MQSSTTITITLFAKNLTADKVVSEFTTDTVKATLIMPDDSIFEKTWKMFGTFDCEGVQKKVNKYKVEFYLKKVPQTQWKAMEAPSSASVAAATPSLNQQQIQERPNQITDRKGLANPYATKKVVDWDALEREAQQEEEEEKPEGEAALNKLFQKIYKDADPEVRRAMMKSYQTSGGTVLSTNWSEVKDKDYEKDIQAPKGQEVRKWNE